MPLGVLVHLFHTYAFAKPLRLLLHAADVVAVAMDVAASWRVV
jgi:hypothetical protein